MKKLESTWYNMAIVLTLISVIAGAALAYVNELTAGPIQQIKEQAEKDAIAAVLCGQEGIAIKAVDPQNASFGGGLTIMVGFDMQGNILGYKVLESNETPGLGAKASDWFQANRKGSIIGMNPSVNNMTVSKDGGEVDAITASTITSRSFLRAVNAAYAEFCEKTGNNKPDAQSGASQQVHE